MQRQMHVGQEAFVILDHYLAISRKRSHTSTVVRECYKDDDESL